MSYHQHRLSLRAVGVITIVCMLLALSSHPALAGERLERIKKQGYLTCGIHPVVAGFAQTGDASQPYTGLEVDLCRAVATAILGASAPVHFVPVTSLDEFHARYDIDLVIRRLSWTLPREGNNGLIFGPVYFYDGQGLLVRKSAAITRAEQLARRTVCVQSSEHEDQHLRRFATRSDIPLTLKVIDDRDKIEAALFAGECDAISADTSLLASTRSRATTPGDFVLLSEQITKEPLAPLLRDDDLALFQVIRWTIFALIEAEELGVTSRNVAALRNSDDPAVHRLLGVIPGTGRALGLAETWAYTLIESLGNYGEIYARHLGDGSRIQLERDKNRLWRDGGLLYAPPLE